jgi:hypothetical protein
MSCILTRCTYDKSSGDLAPWWNQTGNMVCELLLPNGTYVQGFIVNCSSGYKTRPANGRRRTSTLDGRHVIA